MFSIIYSYGTVGQDLVKASRFLRKSSLPAQLIGVCENSKLNSSFDKVWRSSIDGFIILSSGMNSLILVMVIFDLEGYTY